MMISNLQLLVMGSEMSSGEIARLCDFPQSRLSEYVWGKRQIPIHHQIALSDVLGVSVNELHGWYQDTELEVGERHVDA